MLVEGAPRTPQPRRAVSLVEAVSDSKLLGAHYPAPEWGRWRTLLRTLIVAPLGADELPLFIECTAQLAHAGDYESWLPTPTTTASTTTMCRSAAVRDENARRGN